MEISKTKIWIIAGVAILAGVITYFILINDSFDIDLAKINRLAIIGTIAGIIGLGITLWQFLTLSSIAKKTRNEITETKSRIEVFFTITELAKSIKVITEISNFVINNKFEAAELRMQDLKPILIQMKNNNELNDEQKQSFNTSFQDFSINIDTIHDYLINTSIQVDKSKIISNLEKISHFFIESEQNLKQ